MERMFYESKFNKDISNWNIKPYCKTEEIFDKCHIEYKYIPKKYKEYI
jgi:hypothetical protein